MACDTNMDHDPLRQSKWFNDRGTHVGTLANNLSTSRTTVEGSVTVGGVYHDIVFLTGLKESVKACEYDGGLQLANSQNHKGQCGASTSRKAYKDAVLLKHLRDLSEDGWRTGCFLH